VPDAVAALIERLGVAAVEAAHPDREVRSGRLKNEMEVVRHEAVGVTEPPAIGDHTPKSAQECLLVGFVEEEAATSIATACDVVDGSRELSAERSRHGRRR
jgi:hypothetical protein